MSEKKLALDTRGMMEIFEERAEQLGRHGWTHEHDIAEHPEGDLARAAGAL